MAAERMVKIVSGKEEMGMMSDHTDRPVLSSTFWRAFLVSGNSATPTGRALILRAIEMPTFSDTKLAMV